MNISVFIEATKPSKFVMESKIVTLYKVLVSLVILMLKTNLLARAGFTIYVTLMFYVFNICQLRYVSVA